MIDFAQISENDLGPYWLQVWRSLVEMHWDYIVAGTSAEHYDFAHLRRCQSKEHIDDEIATLATNYWERNHADLKEYFINWTCDKWCNELSIEKDLQGGWLDFGVDPCYPNRRHEGNKKDASWLANIGILQIMLKKAKRNASLRMTFKTIQSWLKI